MYDPTIATRPGRRETARAPAIPGSLAPSHSASARHRTLIRAGFLIVLSGLCFLHVPACERASADARPILPDSLDQFLARFEDQLRRSHDADSLRLLLAIRLRDANTVEDRTRAVSILEEMRPTHETDRGFYLELARTYFASRRFHDARATLLKLAEHNSTDGGARLWAAHLLFKDMCHYGDARELATVKKLLREALTLCPQNRDALYLSSALLYITRKDDPNPLRTSWDARGLAERILVRNQADADACLLNAVHCMDLGALEDAEHWFRQGIASLSPDIATAFLVPPPLADELEVATDARTDAHAIAQYWDAQDPTPLTLINETQLHYWYNMVVADLFYGERARGVLGWETSPGRSSSHHA
jgi:tetratricopeptide (TPR) repeat protein